MFDFIRKFSARTPVSIEENALLLNEALSMAMEWGENWLVKVQPRLAAKHPSLSANELNELNAIAQETMRLGWKITATPIAPGTPPSKAEFKARLIEVHPWINEENLSHLFSQSMYYAMK